MSGRRIIHLGECGKVPADALFELYLETRDGHMITLYQTKASATLGSWVYDGAAVLARYLEAYVIHRGDECRDIQGRAVVELGAGTGVVGLLMAHYGAHVTITDRQALVPLIQYNIEQNADVISGHVTAETLCWGTKLSVGFPRNCDYVILANCIYYEGCMEDLMKTLLDITGGSTTVYACYEERTPEICSLIAKWHSLAAEHFVIEDIPKEYYRSLGELDCVRIVKMIRK